MRKFFLIPLMTLVCSVMAWGADAHVSNITDLKAAVANASVETIYLDADIQYAESGNSSCINILRSVTIDGQGHTLSGYGKRAATSVYPTIAINQGYTSDVSVLLKDINIVNTYRSTSNDRLARPVECRGHVENITLNNVTISVDDETKVYAMGLVIGGNDQGWNKKTNVTIENSQINIGKSGYPLLSFNPYTLNATNSTFSGYCGLYFKGAVGSAGSYGTVINADGCDFNSPNVHNGSTDAFAVFPMEDAGITFNLHNCGMNAQKLGSASQDIFLMSPYTVNDRRSGAIVVNISGDNSHYNTSDNLFENQWYYSYNGSSFSYITSEEAAYEVPIQITITGGTYSVNPDSITYAKKIWVNDPYLNGIPDTVKVPDTHEVQEINQGGVTLYRVVKKAAEKTPGVLYDLNDLVVGEGVDEGNNPVSSFDLSTGTGMTLNNEVTTAGYVQISDNEDTGDATIVTVGQTAGGDDQTLVINNGLDVQGESQVIVESGATLQIGEGGINTEKPENIIIEANENGAASLLLDPTITVNQTPNLTVRMSAKQIGRNAAGDFYWHRFAMPVAATITSWDKEGTLVAADPEYTVQYPTYIYGWNYEENKWKNLPGVSSMVPLQGYTLTLASDYIHLDGAGKVVSEGTAGGNLNALQDVVYTFKGNLVGNTPQPLNFQAEGFNFFGNSYTGYMDVLKLIEGIQSNNVEGTVYMWCNDPDDEDGNYQSYVGVPLYKLSNAAQRARLADWQKEVSPMQTFILRLRGADSADESVNYASAIWGNPRYGNTGSGSSPAPRRRVASINEDTYMEIAVKAANGKGSRVDFTESANNSDDFESGYDVVKYMNEKSINLYATINSEDFSSVVTNNLIGKRLSLQTNGEISYTMSFKNVEGVEYAIRDNATNQVIAIEEGVTYEFAAQPNSVIEGRFEIVDRANAPTAIENTEVKANVKGIYTIMGQYLGEDFDILPAGVYVVDGVKIVK